MRITYLVIASLLGMGCVAVAHANRVADPDSSLILELQPQVEVDGQEATLQQVCRWPASQAKEMQPYARIVVAKTSANGDFAALDMKQLRFELANAGLNMANLRLGGASQCEIHQAAPQASNGRVREVPAWPPMDGGPAPSAPAEAAAPVAKTPSTAPAPATQPVADSAAPDGNNRLLREILIDELASRCGIPADQLYVEFPAASEASLALAESQCNFRIETRRRSLGAQLWEVQWDKGGATQHASITASAKVWETRQVAIRPLQTRQLIREGDIEERRVLTDRPSGDPLLNRYQVVGQLASRDIRVGTALSAYMICPMPLVTCGQTVTLTSRAGSVQAMMLAKALENGAYGQTIKVRNETTKAVMQVKVVGPQEAEVN